MTRRPEPQLHPRDELCARAEAIRQRMLRLIRCRRFADAAAMVMLLFLISAVVDAAWPAPEWARWMISIVLYGAMIWLVWRWLFVPKAQRISLGEAAEYADVHSAGADRGARAAVEIATVGPSESSAMTEALSRRAIEMALLRLRAVDPVMIVDARAVTRSMARAAAPLLITLVTAALAPRLVETEALRFLHPSGDHPPYSRLRFAWRIAPTDLRIGDDATVTAIVTGGEPEEVTLAVRTKSSSAITRRSMRRIDMQADQIIFESTLPDIREPLKLRFESPNGRSRWRDVAPSPAPRVVEATVRVRPPAYAAAPDEWHALPLTRPIPALWGSEIELSALLSTPPARVVAPDAARSAIDGDVARATWRLNQTGAIASFTFDVATRTNHRLNEPIRIDIEMVADAPPVLTIKDPALSVPGNDGQPVFALPDAAIPIRAIASDDVGLDRAMIEFAIADSISSSTLWRELPAAVMPASEGVLITSAPSPQEFGAGVGDTVHLRFVAIDNRPELFGGPQITIAGPIAVHVVDDQWLQDALGRRGGAKVRTDATIAADGGASKSGEQDGEESESTGQQPTQQPGASSGEGAGAGDSGQSSTGDSSIEPRATESAPRVFRDPQPAPDAASPPAAHGDTVSGALQALLWTNHQSDGAQLVAPSMLNRLSARQRAIVGRYYELLATPREAPAPEAVE